MATITDIIQPTRNAPPPTQFFLNIYILKEGAGSFPQPQKKLLQLRRNFITTNLSDLQMTQWCWFGILLKVSLCKTRAFTWCTMWSHHLPRNGTKRTLKQTILNSRIPSIVALRDSFFCSNNEVGQVEVSGSPCWRREKVEPVVLKNVSVRRALTYH